jgi:hypothetical protein
MSAKLKKANICPGPGYGLECKSSKKGTPRGGRCRECHLQNMREHYKQNPGARQRMYDKRRDMNRGKMDQAAIELAQKIEPASFGLRGACKVLDAMLRAV